MNFGSSSTCGSAQVMHAPHPSSRLNSVMRSYSAITCGLPFLLSCHGLAIQDSRLRIIRLSQIMQTRIFGWLACFITSCEPCHRCVSSHISHLRGLSICSTESMSHPSLGTLGSAHLPIVGSHRYITLGLNCFVEFHYSTN